MSEPHGDGVHVEKLKRRFDMKDQEKHKVYGMNIFEKTRYWTEFEFEPKLQSSLQPSVNIYFFTTFLSIYVCKELTDTYWRPVIEDPTPTFDTRDVLQKGITMV